MKHFLHRKRNNFLLLLLICCFCNAPYTIAQTDPAQPNILLIIADDLGVDAFNGYQNSAQLPNTPNLDALRASGITFKNAWAAPSCTPTRATIMSGKYGIKTGVLGVPGNLETTHVSIFRELESRTNDAYANALIGKWHLSGPSTDYSIPRQHGIDYYEGSFKGAVSDYFNWQKVSNETASGETTYVTSYYTDKAIDWIGNQNQPWFLWLAHNAAHTPFHEPPSDLHTTATNNDQGQYLAMIEAMDAEIGRLLNNMPENVLDNTIIIFIGDNGTPNGVLQNYPNRHGKGSLYQGGVHVPMIVAGTGVTRQNEEENAMVHATDIYATILELAGTDLPGGVYNSLSFKHLLDNTNGAKRSYNYSEAGSNWTIRNSQYKLIQSTDGAQEFYDLTTDPLEENNLINSLTTEQATIKMDLETEGAQIRTSWSCQDSIQNGDETGIDCGGSSCIGCDGSPAPTYCTDDFKVINTELTEDINIYVKEYISSDQPLSVDNATFQAGDSIVLKPGFEFSATNGSLNIIIATCEDSGIDDANCPNDNSTSYTNIGCSTTPTIANVYTETVSNDIRSITSNNFPNHDYGYNTVAQQPSPINHNFMIDATPTVANSTTNIRDENGRPQRYFGVALNGVIFAPAPAAPFIFENTETGEFNWDWIFEPTNNQGRGADLVGLDCASAHTGGQGYHYHGNPFQYVEGIQAGISTTNTPPATPIQIGWAGDGFPILYRFGPDENGTMKELRPSYEIKYGNRPGDGISEPCGVYNGKYTKDYEYVASVGDLDECNGIARTITLTTAQGSETFSYFYVVTSDFPQIPRCLSGTPDVSFDNLTGELIEVYFKLSNEENTPLATTIHLESKHDLPTPTDLDIQVMPNPTQRKILVSFNADKGKSYQMDILNYQGQQIQHASTNIIAQQQRMNRSFSLENHPAGIYILRLINEDDIVIKKIVKE